MVCLFVCTTGDIQAAEGLFMSQAKAKFREAVPSQWLDITQYDFYNWFL